MAFTNSLVFGHECKIYNNGGTHSSPSWSELEIARDVTLTMEQNESDITARSGLGYVQTAGTLIDASVELGIVWDPGSADFSELQTAFFNRAPVDVMILDGDRVTSGTEGLQAFFVVTSFTRNEAIAEVVTAEITLKLTKNPRESGAEITDVPAWITVS